MSNESTRATTAPENQQHQDERNAVLRAAPARPDYAKFTTYDDWNRAMMAWTIAAWDFKMGIAGAVPVPDNTGGLWSEVAPGVHLRDNRAVAGVAPVPDDTGRQAEALIDRLVEIANQTPMRTNTAALVNVYELDEIARKLRALLAAREPAPVARETIATWQERMPAKFSEPEGIAHHAMMAEIRDLRAALAQGVARDLDVEAERRACAEICERLEAMTAQGAGETRPGERLAQAARLIRERARTGATGTQAGRAPGEAERLAKDAVIEAARYLVKAKGRYHTELNYKALADALDAMAAPSHSPVGAPQEQGN